MQHTFKLDKSTITIAKLTDPSDEREYWWSKTPAERMRAGEFLRRLNYGEDACTGRLERVIEVVKRK